MATSETSRLIESKRAITPLWIVALFVTLTETVLGFAVTRTSGNIQLTLTIFVISFPVLIAIAFFLVLWFKSYVFYPPTEFGRQINVGDFVDAMQRRPQQMPQSTKTGIESDDSQRGQMLEAKSSTLPEVNIETELAPQSSTEIYDDKVEESQPTTLTEQYHIMIEAAYVSRSIEDTEEAFNKLQEMQQDEDSRLSHEAFYYRLRYELGDAGALSRLQELTKSERAAPYAYETLGECYKETGNYDVAGKYYELAVQGFQKRGDDRELSRARNISKAAYCLSELGLQQDAYDRILREIPVTTNQLSKSFFYSELAALYEKYKENELRALALEKALEYKPNDISLRFRAGFAYSVIGEHELSLLHYKTLLQFDESHASALNNIGVQYSQLALPMRAADYFKLAVKQNESLAAANLARIYISAGLASEAEQVLEKARTHPRTHPDVSEQISHLAKERKRAIDADNKRIETAREQQRFFLAYAQAFFDSSSNLKDFAGSWAFSDGREMSIVQEGDLIIASWKNDEKDVLEFEDKFVGKVNNRAARVKFEVSILPEHKSDNYGYAYLSPDGKQLHFLKVNKAFGKPTHSIHLLRNLRSESSAPHLDTPPPL